jgi:hypothetical protein
LGRQAESILDFVNDTPRLALAALLVVLPVAPRPLAAQQAPSNGSNLDKLQLVSLGGFGGRILPSQVEPTNMYGVVANYGEFARDWSILFGVSYWDSRYRAAVVQTFVDSLNRRLDDPTGRARVIPSRISLYDVTFSGEARYVPRYSGELKPYFGVGMAAHVINAEGQLVDGTFVERSLDNIAAGVFLSAGISIKLLRHFGIEGGGRADLLSGFRSAQVRAGGAYYFGHLRVPNPSDDASSAPVDGKRNMQRP